MLRILIQNKKVTLISVFNEPAQKKVLVPSKGQQCLKLKFRSNFYLSAFFGQLWDMKFFKLTYFQAACFKLFVPAFDTKVTECVLGVGFFSSDKLRLFN